MHPEDFMKPDLLCEILLMVGGMFIFLILIVTLVLALTQVSAAI